MLLGERLLAEGVSAQALIKGCGLDPTAFDFTKTGFNPDQPRVPAGNPDGGQWTAEGSDTSRVPPREGVGSSTSPAILPPSAGDGSEPKYEIVKEPPKDANAVIPPDGVPIRGGNPPNSLLAPPHADYRNVYAAGRAIAQRPLWEHYPSAHAAIAQGGEFDFQRDPKTHKLYQAYIPAANYAVGVYMAGAGHTLSETLVLAKAYAFGHSSNYSAQDREEWIRRGWNDADAGRWK